MERKFNKQTGGYKIDLYYKNNYLFSTDWHKTCKAAKARTLEKYKESSILTLRHVFKDGTLQEFKDINPKLLTAQFDREN